MSSLENEALKTRYLQIVQAAWESSFGNEPFAVDHGCKLGDLEDFLKPLLDREPQETSERLFDVLPEAVAPIVSLSHDPRMIMGMYMIVDIGAGTTEFSVDHVNAAGADRKVLCYADESIILGCDQYEWADSLAREDPVNARSQRDKLTNQLITVLRRVWGSGYKKDGGNLVARQRWEKLSVLIAGGGARRPEVAEAIRNVRPQGTETGTDGNRDGSTRKKAQLRRIPQHQHFPTRTDRHRPKTPISKSDPFDRMIITHALRNGLSVVVIDAAFDAYGITRFW